MGKYWTPDPKKHHGIRSNFETSHVFFIQKEVFNKGLKSSSPQEKNLAKLYNNISPRFPWNNGISRNLSYIFWRPRWGRELIWPWKIHPKSVNIASGGRRALGGMGSGDHLRRVEWESPRALLLEVIHCRELTYFMEYCFLSPPICKKNTWFKMSFIFSHISG